MSGKQENCRKIMQ